MRDTVFHNPRDIALALRALADDFADMPETTLAPVYVAIRMQVASWGSDEARRIATVDALTFAALGIDAHLVRMDDGDWHYGTATSGASRDELDVDVFTGKVSAPVKAVAA